MDFLKKLLSSVSNSIMCQSTTNAGPITQTEHVSNPEQNEKVSYDVMITWQQSFDNLMSNKQGQKIFTNFLMGECSDDNLRFWQACEELKLENDANKIEEKARIIYEDYISTLSPTEVSLDSKTKESINAIMKNPSATTFNEAQGQIYTLMQKDSYPRFLASPSYHDLIASGTVEEL